MSTYWTWLGALFIYDSVIREENWTDTYWGMLGIPANLSNVDQQMMSIHSSVIRSTHGYRYERGSDGRLTVML